MKRESRLIFIWVSAARFVDFGLRMGMVSFYPELMVRLGTTYGGVGSVFAAFFLGYALFQIPAGLAADRWPSWRLMVGGLILLSAGALVFASTAGWWTALAARLVMGLGVALISVPGVRLLADVFPSAERGRAIGALEVVIGLAILASLSGMPLMARWVSFETMMLVLGLACLPVAAGLAHLRPEQDGLERLAAGPTTTTPVGRPGSGFAGGQTQGAAGGLALPARRGIRNRQVGALTSLGFLGLLAMNGYMGWLPTYLRDAQGYEVTGVAVVMGIMMGISVPAAYGAGLVSDRWGRRMPVINIGSALMIIGFLFLLVPVSVWTTVAAAVAFGVGTGWNMGPLITFATEALGPSQAGLATSILQTAGQLGAAVAGVLFGFMIDWTGSFTAGWLLGIVLLAARLAASLLASEPQRTSGNL